MKEALTAYPKYGGKLSLTDTVSVEVMRKYGVKEIFSHDSDFDVVKDIKKRGSL